MSGQNLNGWGQPCSQYLDGYSPDYYHRPQNEYWFAPRGLLRPDELAAVCYMYGKPFLGNEIYSYGNQRRPGLIVSIGCGEGNLEAHLESQGEQVIGVDPSPGARAVYRGKTLIPRYEGGGDTILFVESIEHIPLNITVREIWPLIPNSAVIIIVNWLDQFPIGLTGWDHCTTVDDALFDTLAYQRETIIRRGGHLVLGPKGAD